MINTSKRGKLYFDEKFCTKDIAKHFLFPIQDYKKMNNIINSDQL